jgi:hypothetical protein
LAETASISGIAKLSPDLEQCASRPLIGQRD